MPDTTGDKAMAEASGSSDRPDRGRQLADARDLMDRLKGLTWPQVAKMVRWHGNGESLRKALARLEAREAEAARPAAAVPPAPEPVAPSPPIPAPTEVTPSDERYGSEDDDVESTASASVSPPPDVTESPPATEPPEELLPAPPAPDPFEELRVQVEELTARLDGVDTRHEAVGARLEGIDSRLGSLDVRLRGLDSRLEGIERTVGGQALPIANFRDLDSRLVDLKFRVDRLELPRTPPSVTDRRLDEVILAFNDAIPKLFARVNRLEARLPEGAKGE